MNITIIGAGAVGLLVGASFSLSGHMVTMVTRREEQADLLREKGICYRSEGVEAVYQVRASTSLPDNPDIVVVAVKSYQVEEVINMINHTYQKGAKPELLFIQNGMGHVRFLETLHNNVALGTLDHGSKKIDDISVIHTGKGSLKICSYSGEWSFLSTLCDETLSIQHVENWYKLLSEKLVINCGINPLTAIFKILNGELMTNPRYFAILRELIKESSTVLNLEFEESLNRVQGVCQLTAANTSSMLADLKAGRRTEIDAISGFVLREASLKGIDVPYTRFVFDAVKGMELKLGERL
ncbi:2-dehydropantoate 2-reductase [Alkalihalobacillus sp. CinArs1]|uniref:2-dehydropantoate 2-reductase n=1 Tax=Alkalihalobacillus sp. CinArs1 TaxID=2995314 RepID=UPI0022DD85A5|nr:2-dehydropantoate 2-reductase [Alkalihalobacillus sp. CinArs1]